MAPRQEEPGAGSGACVTVTVPWGWCQLGRDALLGTERSPEQAVSLLSTHTAGPTGSCRAAGALPITGTPGHGAEGPGDPRKCEMGLVVAVLPLGVGIPKPRRCGAWGHGLMMALAVLS